MLNNTLTLVDQYCKYYFSKQIRNIGIQQHFNIICTEKHALAPDSDVNTSKHEIIINVQ